MIAAGLEWLKKHVKGNEDPIVTEIDGRVYITGQANEIEPPRVESAINVASLSALCAYINNDCDSDAVQDKRLIINIASPSEVLLLTELEGVNYTRECVVMATARETGRFSNAIHFKHFYDLETFNVAVMTQFNDAGDRAELMKIVGNVKAEESVRTLDDGVTQSVVAKKDIATVERQAMKNPIMLSPKSTFAEVEVDPVPFIVRVRNEGGPTTAALFDASGGAWELNATKKINEYIVGNVDAKTQNVVIL